VKTHTTTCEAKKKNSNLPEVGATKLVIFMLAISDSNDVGVVTP
jgi:hypothetical protein